MADNVTLNDGSGGVDAATDEIASAHYQRIKLIHGADGVNDGDVSTANPYPVDIREVVGTSCDVNAGNVSAGTQRVVIASDQAALDVSGATVTVDLGANNDVTIDSSSVVYTDDTSTHSTGSTTGIGIMAVAVPTDSTIAANDIGMPAMSTDRRLFTDAQIVGQDAALDVSAAALDVSAATVTVDLGANNDVTINGSSVVHTDDTSTHTSGSTQGIAFMAVAAPTDSAVDQDDIGLVAMSTDRRMCVDAQIVGTDAALDVSGATVTVDGSGVTQPVSGTVTANAGTGFPTVYTEDVATPADPDGLTWLMEKDLSLGGTDEAEGDWSRPRANGRGALWVELDLTNDVTIADGGNSITVDNGGTFAVQATLAAGTNTNEVVGDVAHDSAVGGNPLLNGGEARTTQPASVADGDVVRVQHDKVGRAVVTTSPRELVTVGRVALTTTTRTEVIAAGGANIYRDLTAMILSNESSTECRVDIYDLSTGGTAIFSVDLAADGGGATINFDPPVPQATANNAWDAECSTGVSTVYVTLVTRDDR